MPRDNWWPTLTRAERAALGLIILVAVAVRIAGLTAESFWVDEAASWAFSRMPLGQLWGEIYHYEPHPPGYYSILKAWSAIFGESEAALRSLSVVAGSLTVAMTFFAGRLAFAGEKGTWVGVTSAALIALHPAQITYSQEARGYALLCLGVSMVLVALAWWLRHPETLSDPGKGERGKASLRSRQASALFVSGLALAFWMHFTAALLVGLMVAIAILVLILQSESPWRTTRKFAGLGVLVVLLWLPGLALAVIALTQHLTQGFWLKPPTIHQVVYGLDFLVGSYGIAGRPTTQAIAVAAAAIPAAAGLLALLASRQWRLALVLLAGTLLPVTASVVVSYVVTPIFLPRTLLWIEICFVLLIACGVVLFENRLARVAYLALLVSLVIVLELLAQHPKEPWRQVVATLEQRAAPRDLLVVWNHYGHVPLQYYRLAEKVEAARLITWSSGGKYPTLEEVFTPRMEASGPELLSSLRKAEQTSGAVWLLLRTSKGNPAVAPSIEFLTSVRGDPETVVHFRSGTRGFDPPFIVLRFPAIPE